MRRRIMNAWTLAWVAAGLGALLASASPVSAQRRIIRPEGAPADRPYSPGVLVGQTLYVSGQLGLPGTGATPAAMDAQARQAMDGVGAVLKAAGLGYQHLVKCHVYLANMDDYAAMNAAYGSYFTDRVPARTTIQAAGLPAGAGVQITCIGYADLARISVVRPPAGSLPAPLGPYSPAVWAGDTLYVSGMGGQDPATKAVGASVESQVTQTIANITTTLKAAGLGVSDVAWAQGYATRLDEAAALQATLAKAIDSPRGLVVVPRLPGPIRAELTFIATKRTVSGKSFGIGEVTGFTASGRRRGGTAYVDSVVGTGDDIDAQARQAFARLGALLQSGGVGMQDVALVTVYLTDIADQPRMNAIFKDTFPTDPPARVTIQVQPQAKERIRIGLIAAR
jgi:2-iminobutanoate/2-iminopropanoate deaminase